VASSALAGAAPSKAAEIRSTPPNVVVAVMVLPIPAAGSSSHLGSA
jgi:hypothetical protein